MKPFERLLTVLVAVTGLRIGALLALRWSDVGWVEGLIYVRSNFVRGVFGEPKSRASKRPEVLHPLIMVLLKTWRRSTAYAGDQDFVFASERMHGKQPTGTEHAGRRSSAASRQASDRHSPWSPVWLSQPASCLVFFLGPDRNRSEDDSRYAALGRRWNANVDLRSQPHGQAPGSTGQDGRSYRLKRSHATHDSVAVGDQAVGDFIVFPLPNFRATCAQTRMDTG